jgi:hypothetical protein
MTDNYNYLHYASNQLGHHWCHKLTLSSGIDKRN